MNKLNLNESSWKAFFYKLREVYSRELTALRELINKSKSEKEQMLNDIKLLCQEVIDSELGTPIGPEAKYICINYVMQPKHIDPECPALLAEKIADKYKLDIKSLEKYNENL